MDIQATIGTNSYLIKHESKIKDRNLPVINFADYMVEKGVFSSKEELMNYIRDTSIFDDEGHQIIEIDGEKYDTSVQIADLSKIQLYPFRPTGDYAHDYQIQMGINYNRTCYDGTNRRDYDELTTEEDFTGMSPAEIYKAIYEKYQHCYGENFLDINAVTYVRPPQSEDFYGGLLDRFYNELETAIGGVSERQKACRKALYGDMSDYEIRAAIMEKYSSDGTLTNADLYKITKAMDQCGVGGGIHNVLQSVLTKDRSQILYNSSLGIKTSVETACAMYEEMLASPLDADMLEYIGIHGNAMRATSPKLYSALGQIRETYGGYSGGISADTINADVMNKMKSNSERAKASLTWLKPQKA